MTKERRRIMKQKSKASRKTLQVESLEAKRLLAADWQNPLNALDVDASGESGVVAVSPLDALLVINELNVPQVSNADGSLPPMGDNPQPPYVDVDGNGIVSPLDAILVVNELNATSSTDGEGPIESFAPASFIAGSQAALSHLENDEDDDTLVNSTTDRKQAQSDIASNGTEAIIVWESLAQDGSSWGVYAQRYSVDGSKIGDEFQVNTTTRGPQMNPSVAIAADGTAMVVWQDDWADGSGWGITGRAFDSDNNPVTEELLINTTTRGSQSNPDIAENDGVFTVVWEGRGAGDNNGIFSSTVSTTDLTPTTETLVNSYTSGNQSRPSVDASDAGVVIAWDGKGPNDNLGVHMSLNGSDQIRINAASSGVQKFPSISISDDGVIAAAWQQTPAGRGIGVWARTFTQTDSGIDGSSTIQVNETERGAQKRPSIDHLANDGFVVSWFGKGDGDHNGVFSRTFDAGGVASDGEIQINHTTQAGQLRPAVVAVNDGFITTWQGRGTGDRRGIFARFSNSELAGPFRINDIANGTVNEGEEFTVTASVEDLDGTADAPVFSLADGAPATMTIDADTGVISWTPDEVDGPGVFEVTVVATEGVFSDSEVFTVTVDEVNQNPTVDAIANVSAAPGEAFSLAPVGADADLPAQTLTWSAALSDGSDLPSWLSIDSETGVLSGTPAEGDAGGMVVVTVTDSEGGSSSTTFDLTVSANSPPVVENSPGDVTATEAEAFSLDLSNVFTDPDGDALVLAIASGLPVWASFDATTGLITGTPGNADVGSTEITVTADDQNGGTAEDTFTITVSDINNFAPNMSDQVFRIFSDAPNGSSVGTVVAVDPDSADTVTYSITGGAAAGLFSIDSATGEITVTDSSGLTDPGTFLLDVQASDGTSTVDSVVTVYTASGATSVGYMLSAVDDDGNVLTSVPAGGTFNLVLSVQDTRATDPTGVFSAFTDIVYLSDFVSVAGDITHSATYPSGTSGDTSVAGIIDEAGGVDGLSELGGDVIEVLRLPMTVSDQIVDGTVITFSTNEADNLTTHPTLRFRDDTELPATEIDFGTLSLTVGAESQAALMLTASDDQSTGRSEFSEMELLSDTSPSSDLVVPARSASSSAIAKVAVIDSIFATDDSSEAEESHDEWDHIWNGGL